MKSLFRPETLKISLIYQIDSMQLLIISHFIWVQKVNFNDNLMYVLVYCNIHDEICWKNNG